MSLWGVNPFFIHLIAIDRVSGGQCQELQIKQNRQLTLRQGGAGTSQIQNRCIIGELGRESMKKPQAEEGTGASKVTAEWGPGRNGGQEGRTRSTPAEARARTRQPLTGFPQCSLFWGFSLLLQN